MDITWAKENKKVVAILETPPLLLLQRIMSGSKHYWVIVHEWVVEISLTPTDKRYSNNELGGNTNKHDDQFLEHEQSLCPHPHHCHQCEVVD